jgi:two-component system NtrC family response regulator
MADARKPLLIVEDDPALRKQMQWAFDAYETVVAGDRPGAIAALRRHEPAVVTMDLGLPPRPNVASEGLALLEEMHALAPATKVIVLTGQEDRAHALRAIALDAYDFCTKPFEPEVLGHAIARAYRLYELQAENARLQASLPARSMAGLVTLDPGMQRVCRTVEKVAPTSATVLVIGESGTGKELLARALHEQSQRAGAGFVAINCAAMPESVLEAELFGYEKGAVAGAVQPAPGRIELAHGGTLFLDEVGDLPPALQAKLLRVLQDRALERLGSRKETAVDVRVVCATRQGLKERIAAGGFREDLYYRLAEIVVEVPPLRTRHGDAALLAHALLRRFAAEHRRGTMTLMPDAIAAIEGHAWPGNVRELENAIKRAVIIADGPTVSGADLGLVHAPSEALNLREVREAAEREAVLRALGRANGNLTRAAEMLGVSRPTLYDLIHRFGLK